MVSTDNLLSYYKLDETSGTTANDENNTNNLTNYNSVSINQSGKINKSYDFSGANNMYLEKASASGITNGFMINCWIYLTSANQYDTIMSIYDASPDTSVQLIFTTTTNLELWTYDGTSRNTSAVDFSSYFNKWTMVTVYISNSGSKLYLDGSQVGGTTSSGFGGFAAVDQLVFGNSDSRSRTRGINGKIDEIAIFDADETSSISDLYNSGDGLAYPFQLTFNATVLTLSTTEEVPTYYIQVRKLALNSLISINDFQLDGTITELTGGIKTKAVKTNYPITDGLLAKYTKQTGHIMQLIPEEKSLISKEKKKGL